MLELSLVLVIVLMVGSASITYAFASERDRAQAPARMEAQQVAQPSHFFAPTEIVKPPRIPRELAISRLEQHVRQERAAVEQFPESPSRQSLRANTSSPFLN